MMRFRRTVKGILAVRFALCCSHQLSSGAAHQKVGKCYLKLKNENKTLGRTRGRRRDRFILENVPFRNCSFILETCLRCELGGNQLVDTGV